MYVYSITLELGLSRTKLCSGKVIRVSLWTGGGGLAILSVVSHFKYPTLKLSAVFELFFQPDVLKKLLLQKQKQEVCNGETFRGSFTMQSLQIRLYLRIYMWILAVRNMIFIHTPHFPSSQSLSKGSP